MPELPEVETVCRGLAPCMEGHIIARLDQRRPDLRFPLPENLSARLQGRRVDNLARRGKYIIARLDDGQAMILHLGMSGRMMIHDDAGRFVPEKHDHVIFYMDHGPAVAFNDARRFGCLDLVAEKALDAHPFFARMGPEPLGNAFSGAVLHDALKSRNTPVKTALLDQHVVAGLGNIYVCEALFMAGISPRRKAANVSRAKCDALARAIRDVLMRAIAAGGSSLRDYRRADGELGYFQHNFAVYGREGESCGRCGDDACRIRRIVQSGRSTFYCPNTQR